jgi:hypothetical protein
MLLPGVQSSMADPVHGQRAAPTGSVYADCGLVGLEPVRHMVDGEWTGRYLV